MASIIERQKHRKEERRLRVSARVAVASCFGTACVMLGFLSIRLVATGLLFKGVECVSNEALKVKVNIPELKDEVADKLLNSGFNLFKASMSEDENSLIAPYTTLMTLGMLANGEAQETQGEIQKLLGGGSLSEVNSNYAALRDKMGSYKNVTCNMKNSIWVKRGENFTPKDYFLKVNATYYNTDIFMADFSKDYTLNKVNEWLKGATASRMVNAIEHIDENTKIYLLSSLNFNGNWLAPYDNSEVLGGHFKLTDGKKKSVKYMYAKENYLEDDDAEGFIKAYADNGCSFVVIRPTNGMSIYEYVQSLDGEAFKKIIHSKSTQKAIVAIPKFTYESNIDLKEGLKKLGIKTAYDEKKAHFTKIFEEVNEPLYLGEVIQKNYIDLGQAGVNAGSSSQSTSKAKTNIEEDVQKSMIFDSPFLYAVVDNKTKLPLLIGIMMKPN